MFKALLLETICVDSCDLSKLAAAAGIDVAELKMMLDPQHPECAPDKSQYTKIIKAVPVSIIGQIAALPDFVKDELDYLDCQMELMEHSMNDKHQPMFSGMRRLVQRIVSQVS